MIRRLMDFLKGKWCRMRFMIVISFLLFSSRVLSDDSIYKCSYYGDSFEMINSVDFNGEYVSFNKGKNKVYNTGLKSDDFSSVFMNGNLRAMIKYIGDGMTNVKVWVRTKNEWKEMVGVYQCRNSS